VRACEHSITGKLEKHSEGILGIEAQGLSTQLTKFRDGLAQHAMIYMDPDESWEFNEDLVEGEVGFEIPEVTDTAAEDIHRVISPSLDPQSLELA
jgi:hypothetical protein